MEGRKRKKHTPNALRARVLVPRGGGTDAPLVVLPNLDCGSYYSSARGQFIVVRISDINDKIIPFFDKYPLHGKKANDYADFCKVVEIIKNKGHLTPSGLEEILRIKSGMNRGRSN